ncbi:autotransporter outer membrane beta-barrel domain-containing protein [Natrialba asiatica]|uniref:Uncharacterized protein n=1 Tax=Natrialba asiatica (strain ATCC 700177 / DSM 12278 / JCM 9576 / FERM P-10747 / NBRC 102637 / 172P1) TaxID=29540 RepID=M0B6F9_NATA1|nr:hypothetical protein [Natrialba asiatica]ELZ06087.1 hypothetical protein C481_01105 [Natrialba asiatica DSM 12278]
MSAQRRWTFATLLVLIAGTVAVAPVVPAVLATGASSPTPDAAEPTPVGSTADAGPVLAATVLADDGGSALAETTVVAELDGPTDAVELVTTDAAGAASIPVPEPGTYTVTVTAKNGATATERVDVAERGSGAEATFEVESAATGAIDALVTDDAGELLPDGTWVTVTGDDAFGPDRTGLVSADGSVSIDGVEPGTYDLRALTGNGTETETTTVTVTANETVATEFTTNSSGSDIPADRGEDVTELRFQSEAVDDDVVVYGDVEGDVVLAGNTQIGGDVLIAGDVGGDVVVRGAATVERILVGGDVRGDIALRGSGTVTDAVAVDSAETLTVRGNAAVDGSVEAADIGDVTVAGSGSIGELAVENTASRIELTGGSTVGTVTVGAELETFEARGGATVDGPVSFATAATVRLAGGATVGGDLVGDAVTQTFAVPDRLVEGDISIGDLPSGA